MEKEQYIVKAKGYKEVFKSLKLANTSYNKIKKEIKNEGNVTMLYCNLNGEFEILKEYSKCAV